MLCALTEGREPALGKGIDRVGRAQLRQTDSRRQRAAAAGLAAARRHCGGLSSARCPAEIALTSSRISPLTTRPPRCPRAAGEHAWGRQAGRHTAWLCTPWLPREEVFVKNESFNSAVQLDGKGKLWQEEFLTGWWGPSCFRWPLFLAPRPLLAGKEENA